MYGLSHGLLYKLSAHLLPFSFRASVREQSILIYKRGIDGDMGSPYLSHFLGGLSYYGSFMKIGNDTVLTQVIIKATIFWFSLLLSMTSSKNSQPTRSYVLLMSNFKDIKPFLLCIFCFIQCMSS